MSDFNISIQNAQQQIDDIQTTYREWLVLAERLKQAQKDWQHSIELIKKMEKFYFNGKYRELHDAVENGLSVNLTTQGEYSIMSEDTLWNAFQEQQELLWQSLRFAVQHLDKHQDE